MKTLTNTDVASARANVPDIVVYGDPDAWKCICKASSRTEGWMKSTKAMQIPGIGLLVQATTQQGEHIAESVTFVPGCKLEHKHGWWRIVSGVADDPTLPPRQESE